MTKKETEEAAERKKRLQTLRSKQKEQPVKPGPGSASEGGDSPDRKREFIKKMMKKRMEDGAGGAGQGKIGNKKAFLKKAMKKSTGAGGASGKDAGKFPRLKALLDQGSGQAGETPSVQLEELEARITRLEQALEKLLEMIEKEKK